MKQLLCITDRDITGSDAVSNAVPRISVGVVLFDNESNVALYFTRNWNMHTLPGGGVYENETLMSAAKREMLEETGCEIKIIHEIGATLENRGEHDFTQKKYHYVAKVVGEKGELQLTIKERATGATVHWLPLVQAMQILSEQNPSTYQQKFIKRRDVGVLAEVMRWLTVPREDVT